MATVLPRSYAPFGYREPGGHKYRAQPTVVDGWWFASKREANVYATLVLRKKAGEIRLILRQVPFELAPAVRDGQGKVTKTAVKYVADFVVHYADGRLAVLDAKGVRTDAYRAKRRWVEQLHGVTIEEV